jgi:hypothetical protein
MNKQREVIYGFRNEIINSARRARPADGHHRGSRRLESGAIHRRRHRRGAEWKIRQLADWVNLNFPLGMPEGEIVKAAESGKEKPVSGSLFDGLNEAQFAVCNFISDSIRKAYELKDQLSRNRKSWPRSSVTRSERD